MPLINYDTVTEAMVDLAKLGYTHDFSIDTGEDCIVYHKHELKLSPNDFEIDEIYRFEGQTDPSDEMVVYAIASAKYKIKRIIVNAFGTYSDSNTANLIEKLSLK